RRRHTRWPRDWSSDVCSSDLLVSVIVAGTLASGGAGALNCYLDRDLDRIMGRTSRRPIPQGEVSPVHALVFGLALFGAGIVVSALLLPFLASLSILLGAAISSLYPSH